MGRRVLAFFLGMIFGVIFFFGAIAGGLVIAASMISIDRFSYDAEKYLGKLSHMSLLDIYKELSALYQDKINVTDENGKYYTLGEFCAAYEIDINELFGGKEMPEEVSDVPIFELFAGNRDEALKQIKVSVVPAVLNVFLSGTNEDGTTNDVFPSTLIEKLKDFSIPQLFEEGGLATVLADVRLSEVAMGMLPLEQTDENALMYAVGQAKLGPLVGGGFNGNILREFQDGGAFDVLGQMPLVEMLGDSSQYLNAFIGNNAIADMIDKEGNLNPDNIINGVYLGYIVSLHRNELESLDGYHDTELTNENVTLYQNDDGDYALVNADGDGFEAQLSCKKEEHTHIADCGQDGDYTCGKEEHSHDIDCYGYVWYDADKNVASGIYGAIADITVGTLTSGNQDALINKFMNIPMRDLIGDSVEVSGLLENFVDYTIGELMGGEVFDGLYLGQLLGLSRVEVTNSTEYTQLPNIPTVAQNETGEYAKLDNGVWYKATLSCTSDEEEHTHTAACFGYVWKTESNEDASGLYAALADITVGELMGGDSTALMDKLTNIPLRDLLEGQEMSGIFENLADMTIGELMNGGIDNMYLGSLLGFELNEIEKPNGDVIELYKKEPHGDDDKVAKYLIKDADGKVLGLSMDGNTWYEGKLSCAKEEHEHSAECGTPDGNGDYSCGKEAHKHNVAGCYGFVWYEECTQTENEQHSHSKDDLVIDGTNYTPCKDLMDKLSNKQIADLSALDDLLDEMTLANVLGEDGVPSILAGLKDVPIGQLGKEIDNLYLGQLLNYRRRTSEEIDNFADYTTDLITDGKSAVVKTESTGKLFVRLDNGVWYEATLTCGLEEHAHTQDCGEPNEQGEYKCGKEAHSHELGCFGYVWYKVCEDATSEHDHKGEWQPKTDNPDNDYYTVADGMMGKLSNSKVSELGDLNETVLTFTLADVLGSSVPSMLASISDTQIKYLEKAINNVYLGEFLGYTKGDGDEGNYSWSKEDGTPVSGMMLKLANKKVSELGDLDETIKTFTLFDVLGEDVPDVLKSLADTQIGGLNDAINDMYLGDFLGYTKGDLLYGESDKYEWTDDEGNPVTGMMGKLANEKVNNLGKINETIQTFTLNDVLGDNIPAALASLGDTPIGELGSAIDGMYLGSFLQFRRRQVNETDYTETVDEDGNVKSKGAGKAIQYAMFQDGDWYEAKLTCTKTEHTHTQEECHGMTNEDADCGHTAHKHSAACFIVVWYQECTDEHAHENEWSVDENGKTKYFVPATNLLGRMSLLKIDELNGENIINVVNDTELGEVLSLDNSSNALLRELSTIKIGELNGELNGIYVGVAMGFQRKEIDRDKLQAEQETEWTHEYTDKNKDHQRKDEIFKDKEENYYIHDVKHDKYYEAQMICGDPQDGHSHAFECFGYVWYECGAYDENGELVDGHVHGTHTDGYECNRAIGLNEKISNLRIDELNGKGLTNIVVNLTVGDVMDSGMMDLSEENISFLSILFDESGDCSLGNYLFAGKNDPVTYWKNKHNQQSPSDEHGLEWKQMKLSDFISALLDSVTNIKASDLMGQ